MLKQFLPLGNRNIASWDGGILEKEINYLYSSQERPVKKILDKLFRYAFLIVLFNESRIYSSSNKG